MTRTDKFTALTMGVKPMTSLCFKELQTTFGQVGQSERTRTEVTDGQGQNPKGLSCLSCLNNYYTLPCHLRTHIAT